MKVQGRFPLKWRGQGKFLMDGSDPDYEWQGFIPNEHNPATLNPARGFVSSANQHSVDKTYPYYIFDHSFEHYRNRRLNKRLQEMGQITPKDMMALQFDNFNLHASEALPVMLELLDSLDAGKMDDNAQKYFTQLKSWNYNAFPNQEEPTLFQVWWEKLYEKIWSEWKSEGLPIVLPNKYQTTILLKNEPQSDLFDISGTTKKETAAELVQGSFFEMVEKMKEVQESDKDYSWANYKKTSIMHLVPNFKSFSHTNVYTGGGAGILNATSERHGASWRMVVEMGEGGEAFGIYPGGQSGNPGSRFYDNMIKKWAIGEYLNVSIQPEGQVSNALFSTRFTN
jgi:penicillin G amidase